MKTESAKKELENLHKSVSTFQRHQCSSDLMINKTVLKTPRIISEASVHCDQLTCYILKHFSLHFALVSHSHNLLQLLHL